TIRMLASSRASVVRSVHVVPSWLIWIRPRSVALAGAVGASRARKAARSTADAARATRRRREESRTRLAAPQAIAPAPSATTSTDLTVGVAHTFRYPIQGTA